ncbi:bifunctional DNA primase/polymerase [Actinospica robiniae]|uniref:bifunctional DNA primase/polymerase n=1 Tax=Actinospica robiniae TaxID=304901 RepID=UPI0012F9CC67|nr:bifunctional DNA primase/polymerase [Actinospica robiniae]
MTAEGQRGQHVRAWRSGVAATPIASPRPARAAIAPHEPMGPVAEAAVDYARRLGWPLTPGFAVDGGRCACGEADCPDYGAHPVPGAWRIAACATPSLVRVVWRMCAEAPVLTVLGRPVPGADRLGAVSVPALIGVAALELLAKRSAASGPTVDGYGRISFLVDLGHDGDGAAEAVAAFDCWRRAGLDLAVLGAMPVRQPGYIPLPTPGFTGRRGVVWAVKPVDGRALPPLAAVVEVFDRAVRSTYPSLWSSVRAHPA